MKQRHHFEHTSCAFNISYDDDPGYDHSRPVVSRDYNLSGMIKCERTFCHINKNGKCAMPSAISISVAGVCITGSAFTPPQEPKSSLRNPREGD